MNGLFVGRTPGDRHKRCYSVTTLTQQAAPRRHTWRRTDPKNTAVSNASLGALDGAAGAPLRPRCRRISQPSLAQKRNLINIPTAVNFLLSFITALLHTCEPAKCHD